MSVKIKVEFFPPLDEIAESEEYAVYSPWKKIELASWALKTFSEYLVTGLKVDVASIARVVDGLSSTLTRIALGDEDWEGNDLVARRRAERIAIRKAEVAKVARFFRAIAEVAREAARKERS